MVGTGRFELPTPRTPSSVGAALDQPRRINRLESNYLTENPKASHQRRQAISFDTAWSRGRAEPPDSSTAMSDVAIPMTEDHDVSTLPEGKNRGNFRMGDKHAPSPYWTRHSGLD